MKQFPDPWAVDFNPKPVWNYTQGLIAQSMLQLWTVSQQKAYYNNAEKYALHFIDSTGAIKGYNREDYNIDVVNSGKFLFTLRGGAGLSYHTEIYDETENPDNKFFCTRISFPVYVAARIRYRINSKTLITLSGFYNHISNGGIKQPNYGMNFPTLALGVEHTRNPFIIRKPSGYSFVNDPAGWYYRIQIISSYKVVDETETYPEKGVLVTGLNTSAFRRLGHHYALGFGAEYVNDRALKEVIYREGSDVDNKRAALTAGQDFHFGKVVFYQHFGFYVYSPYEAEDPVYQMYGLGIRLHQRIMTGVFIKAHRHIADFMGLSLSFLPGKIE